MVAFAQGRTGLSIRTGALASRESALSQPGCTPCLSFHQSRYAELETGCVKGRHRLLSAYSVPGMCSELCVSFLSSRVPQPQEEGYLAFGGEKTEAQEKGVVAPGPQLVSGGARTPAESNRTILPPPASEAHLAAPGSMGQVPAGRAPPKPSPRGQDLEAASRPEAERGRSHCALWAHLWRVECVLEGWPWLPLPCPVSQPHPGI